MTKDNSGQLTNDQIGWVLNDIAATSKAIERFAVLMVHSDDDRDTEAMRHSVESLAQRIGLLADRVANRLPGFIGAAYGGEAEDWMMPPAYHWEKEKAKTAA
ncbi:hypothetical protein [Bordetella genomosp. 13]|uniref:hypothetical protein n=1 Tax=Bordetella genomosp. 13 TaxID=463040 RepID=UPI0012F99E35|nr:hypothetical protein [Bordetella genomosp. 13]